jgi:hypothetical protein
VSAFTFTPLKFKLVESVAGPAMLAIIFCFLHWIDGHRPLITEFEAGAITAVTFLRLQEAFNIYIKAAP